MSLPNFKIPFSGVGVKYSEEEKAAVMSAMDASGTYTQGPLQEVFRANLRTTLGLILRLQRVQLQQHWSWPLSY